MKSVRFSFVLSSEEAEFLSSLFQDQITASKEKILELESSSSPPLHEIAWWKKHIPFCERVRDIVLKGSKQVRERKTTK